MMECPRCKEITLALVDDEATDDPDKWVKTYECDECGHLECHVSGLTMTTGSPTRRRSGTTTTLIAEGVTPQNGETKMETINLRPTWKTAVRIYIAVLRNPDATNEAHDAAEADLLRLAEIVDNMQRENDHE